MARLVIPILLCLFAVSAIAQEPAETDSDARGGIRATLGAGVSLGHVKLSDGVDSIDDGEVGFAVNGDLGYHLSPRWALHLSFRSFSQTDQDLFDFFPTLCVVIGPAATWYFRPNSPSFLLTLGVGYPFDGLDSVNAKGAIAGFAGIGYQFHRSLRVELDGLIGVYDEGGTFGLTITANLGRH
jgi:hypothetical protein